MNYTLGTCEKLEKSIDILLKIDSLTNNQKASTHLKLARLFEKMLYNDFVISETQIKSLTHLGALIEKNDAVYANRLITDEEYNKNGLILFVKIIKKIDAISKPKIKKAAKSDVYYLRASLQNIDSEN